MGTTLYMRGETRRTCLPRQDKDDKVEGRRLGGKDGRAGQTRDKGERDGSKLESESRTDAAATVSLPRRAKEPLAQHEQPSVRDLAPPWFRSTPPRPARAPPPPRVRWDEGESIGIFSAASRPTSVSIRDHS